MRREIAGQAASVGVTTLLALVGSLVAVACSGGPGDPCSGVSCSSRGFCLADQGAAYCACIRGYHPVALACLPNEPDGPCAQVTCEGHGTCRETGDEVTCDCAPGYGHPAGTADICTAGQCDLLCTPIPPADGAGDDGDADTADLSPPDGSCSLGETPCGDRCADLSSDPDHCGECGVPCRPSHASGSCVSGACVLSCDEGWSDADGAAINGCEYACRPAAATEGPGTSCADGTDNDCDGRTDETDPDCADCVPEFCNGADDDCDGLTDEDYDLDFDPAHCGTCSRSCPPRPQGRATCMLGRCDLACNPGWTDRNGDLEDGCESSCTPQPSPEETSCDGVDSDCDGLTDEEWASAESCGIGACLRSAVCHRGTVTCVPRRPTATDDSTCNGIDDDCDGVCDEDLECCRGAADERACRCGATDTRSCGPECTWGSWSGCPGEECSPGQTEVCGPCETRTCDGDCRWEACTDECNATYPVCCGRVLCCADRSCTEPCD